MILSNLLVYCGECNDALNFYSGVFENAIIQVNTYAEMPMVESYGIKELDMVWRSTLTIPFGRDAVRFSMSDSLVIAMGRDIGFQGQAYNPLIYIEHTNEQYVRDIFAKLYGNKYDFEETQQGACTDLYGIRWVYKKTNKCSIYHKFEFNGYCLDVINYISDAFQININELLTYGDSMHEEKVHIAGLHKIYSAEIGFCHYDYCYKLMFKDSMDSAIHNKDADDPNTHKFYQIILLVESADEEHLIESFKKLSVGAKLNRQIARNEKGILQGSLIDHYGIVWELMSL